MARRADLEWIACRAEMMTPHFSEKELTCKCGCGMLPSLAFVQRIERLRVELGFPMPVSSGARCPKYNALVSSSGEEGPHTTGNASDFLISRAPANKLLKLALINGFTGIGIKQHGSSRFIHLDTLDNGPGCPRPTIWSYP